MIPNIFISAYFSILAADLSGEARYEYVEDRSRAVAVHFGETLIMGKIDRAGNFVPNPGQRALKMGMPGSGAPPLIINYRRPGIERVFEYRSGRLIKGELDREGNFVPELGSKVISFKDYHYSPKAFQ